MTPSANENKLPVPRHIAIIMDGTGRWAKNRGLPRTAGHAEGGKTFRAIAEYDQYLRLCYGDYMQLPPENKRKPEHFEAFYN